MKILPLSSDLGLFGVIATFVKGHGLKKVSRFVGHGLRNASRFFRDSSMNPSRDNGCSRVYEGLMNSAACTSGNHLHKFDAIVEINNRLSDCCCLFYDVSVISWLINMIFSRVC
ncbi:hypothetical protein HanOQP8_Chr01g0025951 [Helianthus annuus]|nr:hypothetical protein HanOQP8_Chr01g0025951 [Helianthus annuus]